jgi:hypothetical protein
MSTPERPFASYHLWSLIAPAPGQERWHCQMRRGYIKAKQHQPEVKALLAKATASQHIGILAQKGVYEFHRHRNFLTQKDGVERVAQLLELSSTIAEVQQRVLRILKNYHSLPFLLDKDILELTRGDEGFPKPIAIDQANYSFRLYAAMDCVFIERDVQSISSPPTLHILDFKTGKSSFDHRQALVYLLAARYLYPVLPGGIIPRIIASFYNLETRKFSELISISNSQLDEIELKLANIADKHQQDMCNYHEKPHKFSSIFTPNPGYHCRFCPFNSICDFSSFHSDKPRLHQGD